MGRGKLEQYYEDRTRMCSTDRDGGGTIAMLNPHKMLLLFFRVKSVESSNNTWTDMPA